MRYVKALICVIVLIFVVSLCACAKDGSDIVTTPAQQDPTEPMSTDVTDTDEKSGITVDQLTNYVIVRPDETDITLVEASMTLRKTIKELYDLELDLKSDLHSDRVESLKIREFEILIGACDRDETRLFMADLRMNDYGYAMVGQKLVICGGSDEATLKALNLFAENILNAQSSEMFFDSSARVLERGAYAVDTFTLQGTDISEYTIVYKNRNENSRALAEELRDRIAQTSGFILPVKNDKEARTGKEILIGTTSRTECSFTGRALADGTYMVAADDTFICARGADGIGDYYAVYDLMTTLFDQTAKTHQVMVNEHTKTVPMDATLKAMSFNLWVSQVTSARQESVRQTIMAYMPDTIGVQEASPEWMAYLNVKLKDIYAVVGLGRDGGSDGEHSAIFYRRDRFDLLKTETKWMSDTPDKVSKFNESSLNRIFTYAILKEKKTGVEIMVVNTHLDHKSDVARNKQSAMLIEFLKDYTDYPIVLTGDFNANPSTEVYKTVTSLLADSSKLAQTADDHYTYHNYGNASTYIDYAFVSKKNVAVSKYDVITEAYNDTLPSDHYALIIEYNVLK